MYIYKIEREKIIIKDNFLINLETSIFDDKIEVHYWRKFYHLNNWMSMLYESRCEVEDDINCLPILLTEKNIIKLLEDSKNKLYDLKYDQDLKAFINKILKITKNEPNYSIVYIADW